MNDPATGDRTWRFQSKE